MLDDAFTLTQILSEGREGEAWEPCNKMMPLTSRFLPLPNLQRVKAAQHLVLIRLDPVLMSHGSCSWTRPAEPSWRCGPSTTLSASARVDTSPPEPLAPPNPAERIEVSCSILNICRNWPTTPCASLMVRMVTLLLCTCIYSGHAVA
jgi:hypothetical protein